MEPTNPIENGYHFNFRGTAHWLGIHDTEIEGLFVYESDGTEITFDQWNAGEPNNLGDEHCVQKQASGFWNDGNCDQHLTYVCEYLV